MKKRFLGVLAITIAFTACQPKKQETYVSPQIQQQTLSEFRDGTYLIALKNQSSSLKELSRSFANNRSFSKNAGNFRENIKNIRLELNEYNKEASHLISQDFKEFDLTSKQVKSVFTNTVSGFIANLTAEQVSVLQKHPNVKSIELVPNGELSDLELTFSEYVNPTTITRNPQVWSGNPFNTTVKSWGYEVVRGNTELPLNTTNNIWIFDSGVDLDHPDLNLLASDSWVKQDAEDLNGHGTHVAGIIAAKRNNGIGIDGVQTNPVICIQVGGATGGGDIQAAEFLSALDAYYNAGILVAGDVVNMSFTFSGTSQFVTDFMREFADRGIKFVMAAGNNVTNAANFPLASAALPVSDESKNATLVAPNGSLIKHYKNIYVVSAFDKNREFATRYSNYGAAVNISAPGTNIVSLYKDGGYSVKSGTSMAAPYVAGLLIYGEIYSFRQGFMDRYVEYFNGSYFSSLVNTPFVSNDNDGRPDFRIVKRFSNLNAVRVQ